MIDEIIAKRSRGDAALALTTETKLLIKGFDRARYDALSPDDSNSLTKLRAVANEMGIQV